MKKILFLLLAGFAIAVQAQNDTAKWRFQWHGFVNPVLYADTRQVVSGREGMMLFYPKPVELDANGNDLNAEPSLNMLAITTRANLTILGPDVLGAKMKGFIEADFSGATDATINMFRLRHAYIDMRWQRNRLILGQYWYPMVVEEIMPGTQPLNMGAPFHPYARYNQIRDYFRLGRWELMTTAAFQLDNKSQGPEGSSTIYLRRSMLPELNLQLRYQGERLFAGVAVNYQRTVPITNLPDTNGNIYAFKGGALNNLDFSFFAKYRWDNWTVKAQFFPYANLYESCMLGGYSIDENLTIEDVGHGNFMYSPFEFTTVWADFGKTTGRWRPGIFAGYAYNDQYAKSYSPNEVYGRGYDLAYLWRVQPRIEYYAGHGLNFAFEVEHTVAQYVKNTDTYRVIDPDNRPANTRFILSACYAF